MRIFLVLALLFCCAVYAAGGTVEVYAIRGLAEGKDFECDEQLKEIEKALKSTGLKKFFLISKKSTAAVKGNKVDMELPRDCKASVSVEEVKRSGNVSVRIKVVQKTDNEEKTLINTKTVLKKPLIIRLIRLQKGYLLLAVRLKS